MDGPGVEGLPEEASLRPALLAALEALCEAARRVAEAKGAAVFRHLGSATVCLASSRALESIQPAARPAPGQRLLYLSVRGKVAGALVIGEPLQPEAPALQPLARLGELLLERAEREARTRRLGAAVRQRLAALAGAEDRLETRLALARHELKTPLAAVKSYVDMLLRGMAGPTTPAMQRYLERVAAGLERARILVDTEIRLDLGPQRPSGSS